MSRARPALVAVLLVVAGATATLAVSGDVTAPVEPGDDPVVGTSENATRVLLLTEADAAAFNEPNTTVTNTLEAGHQQLSADLRLKQVERRLETAGSEAQRRQVLVNATDWAERRLDELRARERSARDRFASGDITAAEYVLELGTIHSQADELVRTIGATGSEGTLYAFAGTLSDSSAVRPRLSRIRTQLVALEGPVRARAAAVIHGERDSVRVHVTAGNGVMLSTIENGQYIRETYREDNLVDETADYGDVQALVQSYYPWVSNNTEGGSQFTLSGRYATQYSVNHPYGSLVVWISAASDRVYVERQELTLEQFPATIEHTDSAGGTTLATGRTYAGGPLLVRVENTTGAPVDSTISLNGREVGATGDDGRLWVLSPAGEYNVTTTTETGATLEVNVTARPAP
ncbi:MAG: hypothetical protein ABEH83_07440 [Halobacterium sp.]